MSSRAIRLALGIWLVFEGISLPFAYGWERKETLDHDEKVLLSWTSDMGTKVIEFEYTVQTLGWVGLGFSSNGGMLNSDVVTAWVKNGKVFFTVSLLELREDRGPYGDWRDRSRGLAGQARGFGIRSP